MRKVLLVAAVVFMAGVVQGQTVFTVSLDGPQVPTASPFVGSGTVTLNAAETQMTVAITHNSPGANVTMAHIHQGAFGVNGGVIFPFSGTGASPINDVIPISPAQVVTLKAGNYYVNIHTIAFGAGEIRGQINPPVDTDADGLIDGVETDTGTYNSPSDTGTDPNDPDSDDDGVPDGVEVSLATDPNNALSFPTVPLRTAWLLAAIAGVGIIGVGMMAWRRKRRSA